MNKFFWSCVAGVVCALGLVSPSWADDKKDTGKGKDDKIIIIQLDASKVPPELLKKLLEMSKGTGKDEPLKTADDKKPVKKDDDKTAVKKDDDKKPVKKDDDKTAVKKDDDKKPVKKDDDKTAVKKDDGKKPNVVQVDLDKLPPDLAKRLAAELAKNPGKEDDKKSKANDDDKKGSKKE